jgi:hypothetical protein
MYNMRDQMQHRAESGWKENMLKLIDEAEVFQLFWSEAAANSQAVHRELEAVQAKVSDSPNFVRVVYWKQPPANLPESLRHVTTEYLPEIADAE